MPEFPLVEGEIFALATAMQSGYASAPADFPHADLAGLTAVFGAFKAASAEYMQCKAAAALAAKRKREYLQTLTAFMRLQLKQSEADTAQHPLKLEQIGWGPRAKGKTARVPGEPQRLVCEVKEHGAVYLRWSNPVRGDGGRVMTYIVERREWSGDAGFNEWRLVAVTHAKEILLTEEPRGQRLEYRILGMNRAGQGAPGNVATVMV